MNKIVNIFITIVFLTSFIGIQINKHYSNGELYSVAISKEAKSCCETNESCEKCDMTSKHCKSGKPDKTSCKNETETIKIDDVFNYERFFFPPINSNDLLTFSNKNVFETSLLSVSHSQGKFYSSSSPPKIELDFQTGTGVFLC